MRMRQLGAVMLIVLVGAAATAQEAKKPASTPSRRPAGGRDESAARAGPYVDSLFAHLYTAFGLRSAREEIS